MLCDHKPIRYARQPVHVVRFDGSLALLRRPHLDGWQGPVPRQHLRGTALAEPEIRVRRPECLGNRIRGEGRRR